MLGGLLLLGLWPSASWGTEPDSTADVTDLAWIAGDWTGGEGDTFIEEQWSPPQGNSMMGMFRMIQSGQVVFYEFMTLEQEGGGPILRIKHFDPGLKGWEERDDSVVFHLAETGNRRVVFSTSKDGHPERLVFERRENTLVITLEKPAKGTRTSFQFRLQEE